MNNVTNSLIDTGVRLSRFVPLPKQDSNINFAQLMQGLGTVAKSAIGTATGNIGSVDPVYQEFLEKQMQYQEQMLYVSLASNVEKTAHDTKMAAVRNIRAN